MKEEELALALIEQMALLNENFRLHNEIMLSHYKAVGEISPPFKEEDVGLKK